MHARLNPSSASGWANCPDYPNAQLGIPDKPSEAAQRGTCKHWVLEQALVVSAPPDEFVGKVLLIEDDTGEVIVLQEKDWSDREYVFHNHSNPLIDVEGGRVWTITQDMADDAQVALAHAYQVANRLDAEIFPERRVNPGVFLDRDDCFGTADITIFGKGELHIYDYKTGHQRVLAQGNLQLILYAIGALADLLPRDRAKLKSITLGIIQPTMSENFRINQVTITPLDLWIWVDWFRNAAKRTDEDNPPRIPGEVQCKWCRAKATCPALRESMFEGIFELNDEHTTDEQIVVHGEAVTTREPGELEIPHLSAILELTPLARDWLSAVESYALDLLLAGKQIPNHKLVRKQSMKRWVDDNEAVIKKLTTNLKIPKVDVVKPEAPIGVSKVERIVQNYEKLYPEKTPLTDRKRKGFAKLWTKPQGEITIAPESDPRPAIARSPEQMAAGMLTKDKEGDPQTETAA